ncbi:MAG TPA: non-ribosomal peptide synthase/polyketide synthase [Longimicrobium sp.]
MSEVLGRVDKLSPERRALLQKILRQQTAPAHEPDAIRPRAGGGPAPLSFAQERLWFIDRLEPGSAVYNIPAAWRLAGALDERALGRALGEIVRRHEVLRTTFGEVDGSPAQVVAPFGGFALPVEDLSGLGEADREAAVRRRAGEEARRGFDLSAGPLFRAALLRLGAEDHVLLLTMHHAVSDGWSTGVLFRELSALYAAYRQGGESPLPELAVQYADYAVWQREQLVGEALERQLSYWRERLAGAPELLELPTDRPRPPVQTHRGASVPVELSPELLERLQVLALREGATLYMVLLGAFQVLLSKYSGSEDIVVGSPIAGRTRREVEELIGFFVNTLVLRADLGGDPGFRDLLGRVREATLGAYAHQEVPFEKLVAELQPERSLSHSPLFQVSFTLQNVEGRGDALAGLEVSGVGAAMEIAKFDLALTLAATPQGLRGALNYSTDLFERATVERMLGHLALVLEQVAADADVRLSELELLGGPERALVLEAWNRAEAEYPADRCIHERFEAQAARTPEAVAVTLDGHPKTYRELDEEANRLAHHLRKLGARPDTLVGLCVERSFETVVGILGILKSGAGYLPLDPAYPEDRLAYMVEDSGVSIVVSTGSLADGLRSDATTVVRLDVDADAIAAESSEAPEHGARPDSLAYVIYTSGSTGKPKGVEVTHANVVRLFAATEAWFGFGESDVWTLFHSYAFDFSVWELWGALLYGGRVVVVPELDSRDPEAFHALVQREGVTVLNQTPSAFRQLIRVDGERGGELALRVVVFGGEALEPATLREWVERRGAETPRLVNMYGITETTVHVTYRPLGREDVFGGSGSPIGVRIPDLRLYVLDPARRPVPIGVPGELYVGGGGVARGYLNRPELTAQRFVQNPFGPGKLYRTGDRVRWLADGTLDYMGRLDEQVKIRGFRIELGEIEVRLAEHPEVREAVVLAREDVPGDRRLVAYVVGEVEAGVLREHLRRELPEYMVPAAFVSLDALPLTPNGKLDRKALPAPEGDAYARGRYEAPLGEVEAALAGIWAEVLGVERVGRWDHFFELGGHSLLAIRLIERMRRAGLYVDVRALFTTPVLADLALAVGGASPEVEVPANRIPEGCELLTPEMLPLVDLTQAEIDRIVAGVPGGAANVQDIYPLAPLQEGILFHHVMAEDHDPYLNAWGVAFDTRERLDAFLAGLRWVVGRHDILRTGVVWEGLREPVQVVWRGAELPVQEVAFDPAAGDVAAQLWERFHPRNHRIDIGRAPMMRLFVAADPANARWVLLWWYYHLLEDHTTFDVIHDEVEAHMAGRAHELPPPQPYRNYVAQARLGVSREEHERFFRELLGDVTEPTVPFGVQGAWRDGTGVTDALLRVDAELSRRLRERAQALGVSAASVFHLAWAQVLARVSGRDDVVFGTVLFGRMAGGEGADRVMGLLINTLPVRLRVGAEGAAAAVRSTHALLAGLLRHEHASLAMAQRCSGVAAPTPLFTSLLNYRHSKGGGEKKRAQSGEAPQALPGMRGIMGQERTNYPVSLSVDDRGERFSLAAQVAAPAEAERVCRMMHTALERLVEALERSPGRAMGSLDVLPEAERALVVEEWNRTEAEYPADRCIHELFEEQAARTPGAVALRFGEESLTYAELDGRANRLAHHLRGRGVGPEVRVGVLMERGVEMVVSLLAVLKAGGAYVPLDPAYPAERLAFMLADSGAGLLLTRLPLPEGLPPHAAEVVCLDADRERIEAGSARAPTAGVLPGNLAYVIYTSGSTGTPKGVMVPHRGVPNLAYAQARRFGIDDTSRVLQFASLSFDAAVAELFDALLAGATLVLAPREALLPGPGLLETLRRGRVTVATLPPSVLSVLPPDDLPELRTVVSAGEAVDAATVERWSGGRAFVNAYGPTETTVCAASARCEADGRAPAIGRALENVRVYVLDAAGRPAPLGVPGELYVGGVGVARGYLGRPGLTAEKFVPDPFGGETGARLYRTGDRVRWSVRGELEFLGRVDAQVKVRGFRIEPGEIEAVLRRHERVADCVVVAREDVPGEKRLVAYVVGDVEAGVLREHLLRELPEHMVPSAYVFLDALPLSPNGKLDRKALPAPELASALERYVAPRTPLEEVLAEIWAEVLRLERVGVTESFFELGGHSLLATRVVSRVRQVFGVEVPLRVLFEGPTVAELAGRVEAMRRAGLPVLPPVVPAERTGALPLSFAQERLWFIDRLEPGSAVYNMFVARRLEGALDEAALEWSLGEIVRRHEALRTVFAEADGAPVQVIAPFDGFALPVEDLSGLGEADREAAVRRRVGEEASRPFDLAAGPLFRAALLRLGEEDHVLLLSMHHIVSDGWSMGVLFRELAALYAAYREGGESPLPELAVQYADYAVWQREQLEGEALDRQLSYWRERLAGAPELLELPTDHPRSPVQTHRGASVPVELSPELLERLQALGRSEGATLYMTLLGAFQVLLGRYAGSEDVVVGSPIAGRTRGEVEELIGFFVNTLVLRTDLSGDPSFREVLERVREATLGAYEHQEVPFEKLVAELQPERSLSHSPLFQVMFTLQNAGGGGGALAGLKMSGAAPAMEVARFDLSLELAATPRGLRGGLSYSTDLFERGTIERMLGHLERVLEQVAADADVRLSQLELLGQAERALVLEEWSRTAAGVPANRCVHELFAEQAARTPETVAVVFAGAELTYAELDARANQLAHYLRALGVGPEVRVGLCVERTPEMVVAVLAVLKAGGAYVPLDPEYPADRLAFMLQDAAVPVLLTHSSLEQRLPAHAARVVRLDVEGSAIAREPAHAPESRVAAQNLAYVIYTSGSTGRPKGAAIPHGGLARYLAWAGAEYASGSGQGAPVHSSLSFDLTVTSLFVPLLAGEAVVLAPDEGVEALATVLRSSGPFGFVKITPAHLSLLLEQLAPGEAARATGRFVVGGESLPGEVVARWGEVAPEVSITNEYGPTETVVGCCIHTLKARDATAGAVPIGRPSPGTVLYALDGRMSPCPIGVPGELFVGGGQLGRGYLARPALTAERFVPDPFSAEPGARLYRTGDRVRWRADGNLEFMGRLDEQVKIRGFRIELEEVEGAVAAHAAVREARVVVREDETDDRRLVAYVVGDAEAEALRAHVRQSLPEYMVPAAFVFLDALPLTANGKLDRKALPAPEGDAYARRSYEAPLGEVEAALAQIWGEVLGVERVGRWDHFFELGGHSLLAIKLIGRMRRAGLYVDVRALFTTPVLAELALAVGRTSSEVEVPANGIPEGCELLTPEMIPLVDLTQVEIDRIVAEVPGGAANVQDIYPLAPLQEGILFHHLLSREGDPYLLSSVGEFETRARLEQYLAALQAVIDRHDVLRTAVAWEGLREPVQVVWRHAPLPVEEVQLDAAEDAAGQLWRRHDPRRYRMELGRAPLLRACIAEDRARGRWLLLMLRHHLTSDHESLEVQREEISAHLRGVESKLPAPLPFRNYVARARLGVSREEHERFFSGMLGDVEEPTAPYGLLDVLGEGHGIAEARLPVAGDVAARLRRRARALGVSAASLCHLAWAQVLARLSGRADVVFGTLLFGRGGEGADRVMGPLINTLPVRIGVGEEGVEAAVRRTHALLADLLRHEHASLALAQRCSGVAAPTPLFTSLLNYRYGGATRRSQQAGQPGAGVRGIRAQERTNYPVALAVDDLGEAFSLVAQVSAPAEAERVCRMMHTALERLVEALEATPGRAIGSLDVLPEAERRTVVEAWNRTDAEYPRGVCVHELFEAQVERTPDAVALVYEDEEVTYAELNARANRLAHHLGDLGVGPESRVGLCVERGIEMVVAVLAVLKAGGAYVPLDPEYPEERLRYMLRDSAPVVLLTQRSLSERFDGSGVPIEVLDGEASAWTGRPDSNPGRGALTPENLAYVIYTSGSTGQPKGVMNGHRGVINLLAWGERHWELGAGDALLQRTSLSFDVSVRELFSPLLAGARLVLVRPGGQREVDYLVEVVRRREVSTLVLTPSQMQAFLEHPGLEGCSSLRRIVLGGEPIPVGMVAELRARLPGARLYHEYGPTEASVTSTVRSCGAEGEAPGASIGRPISNARIYLLDARGEPVPVGVAGELYVGGAGVARGYLGRPALTAERFVPDSFGAQPGARLYRTGDLGRWLADGTIEFLGRVDTQVKVRGYRIELGEIEARLLEREGVSEAAVVAHEDAAGNRRLAAYVVGGVEAAVLREHLRRKLPDFMVPAAFVPLERLPLTPSGKLDRRALPAPELASAEERYVAPRTPTEEVLAEIWAEMLRLERVGVTESFFELGGHSLLATRVVSRVRQVFGVELPLRALFEGPTVAELAGRVEEMRRAGLPVLPPVVPIGRTGALPLSFAQERLWFLDRLEPGRAAYNILAAWRLGGALDVAALERALGEIVRRHEALRTTFAEADGSPVQVIAPFGGFALPVEDLSGLGEADREAAVRRRAGEEERQGFDLSAGPLFRLALLRLGAEDHVLLLSMHHIVSDGWSLGVLFRELSALYAAYREGGESPLPELAVQYADHAVWQREQLAGEVLDRQLEYWKERLAGAPELLELPTDRPRPAVQMFRGARERIELPLELLERLQRLGRSEGATLYMVMLSAFQVLLSKYAGSEDVVVGSPIAGRTRREVEELIGFFVNTLVLRTDLSGDPGFREVLRRVREATLGAYEHQEVPFERLVAELQPERSLSHSPLFQVVFSLQDRNQPAGGLAGLKGGGVEAELGTTRFDLELNIAVHAQGLRGGLNYSTDLFDRTTVRRMLGHLERVLEQVAADADVRLSQLELLSAEERGLVVDAWNRTERGSSDPPAHALFAEWARRAPEAVAFLDGRKAVTYGALDRRAAVLARHLRELGVGPETPVGLCMERTPELLVGVLGIWKAGGAYVPLDPGYPAERLGWILTDAALPVVVATGDTAGVLPEHGATLVRVDRLPETAAEAAPEVPASDAGLAYVIYTSGSTGRPKGVLVQHGSLANLLAATREAFGVGEGDVMPALASYAFDIWLFEALLPLISGGAVRLVERERVLDAPALLEEIADATLVHAVPALMRQLVHAERETPRLGRLRRVFVGGDRVMADLLAEMRETLPGAETHVLYGPTEGTILASTHPVPQDGIVAGHPIGRPLGNVRLYVCDGLGSPQPAGVPGELLIGGAGVARGYLGRAGLTAERFVPDPFSVEGGARLYRTGDRARWRADGTLEYLGRLDGQVKIRGFRIEPGEIEAVLRGHADVTDCVVVAREDAPGDWRLVAYVVGAVEADELREHLRGSLPEYMVPSAFVALDRLPLTPNGKLDRKSLPAPDFAPAEERYVAPRTPTEEVLAEIWAETLRLERVGVTESFFELGGHSLLATRVVSRIRAVFGVEVPLRALFEGPTVAELAKAVEDERRRELPVLPPVVPVERTGALPLSFAQERIWFLDRLEPGSATYNIPGAWRLTGALDERALERAVGEIVRRHETLRTTFGEVDDSPVQVVAPFDGFVLPVDDLSGLSAADREAALRRRAGEEVARPFDLSAGPLFRAALLRLGEEDHVLLLSMHHVVSDGWSVGVLFRELSALYAAYREGRESPLSELPVQYADFAVWQRKQLAGEMLDRQLAYWKERLAGAPELLELPTDHPRPAVQTYRGATVPVELSPELLERLQALGRSEGATLYMTLLGAFQVLLGKYAGSEDVVVGSPIAGRTRGEIEELIGFFINTLVLRTDLSGDPGFREVLRRVREATLGAYANQELPFEKLVAELQPERSLSHSPLFQVMFTLQDAGGGGSALPGLKVGGIGAELASAKFDLSLTLMATPQGLRGGLNYSTDLFERGTIERMLGHLERVLEQVAADADVRLSRLELLGESERALVLEEWNRTGAEYPADRCIHELFEMQAARTPGAVALRFEEESLTYAELNARANRLAHHLAGLGAGPEARVGICVDRSAEMVVAMLAVLKSGAAYLPLDPSYPAGRLAYMLKDSGAPLLVTQESLRGLLPTDGVRIVSVDEDAAAIAANSADAPRTPVDAANAAYVIYTSGSTGEPKGVQVTHGNAVSFFAGMDERVGGPAAGTWLAVTRISFDIHVLELLWTLARGFRVVVQPEPDRARDGESIAEQIRRHSVTHLQCTPSLAAMMIAESGIGALSGLERILLGGEALSPDLAEQITAVLPNGLVNMYGPTETTVWSATHAVEVAETPIPIGRPIANTRVYVLDAALRPQPAGVPGELFIGGHGVTRGYLGRPGLTAERFVPDAFSAEPGARLYRTGDRARWTAEGVLEYLGRLDAQVKVRGFRIEPGEIEAVLRRHPAVVECAVVARAAGAGDTRLVAYVVGAAEADALRAHAGRSLPDYMVPSAFVPLDALPLTPNGKLDRKALPAPEGDAYASREYVAPRTEAERKVAAAWAEVLGVESVGAHDRFFDLGGHSLLLVRVQARLREAFGQPVPITHLFRYLTVSALAAALDAPAPEPAAAQADDARVRSGRHRLRARGRAGATGSRGDG